MKANISFFIIFVGIISGIGAQTNPIVYEYDSIKMASLYSRSKDQRIKNPELSLELGQEFLDMAKNLKIRPRRLLLLKTWREYFLI